MTRQRTKDGGRDGQKTGNRVGGRDKGTRVGQPGGLRRTEGGLRTSGGRMERRVGGRGTSGGRPGGGTWAGLESAGDGSRGAVLGAAGSSASYRPEISEQWPNCELNLNIQSPIPYQQLTENVRIGAQTTKLRSQYICTINKASFKMLLGVCLCLSI